MHYLLTFIQGEWKPKQIDNPAYKGEWVHPEIDNPEYAPDADLYKFDDIGHVGFEIWQVKAGTIFDNIFVSDSVEEAEAFAKDTFEITQKSEKVMKDKIDEEERKKQEEDDKKRKEEEDTEKKEEPEEEVSNLSLCLSGSNDGLQFLIFLISFPTFRA